MESTNTELEKGGAGEGGAVELLSCDLHVGNGRALSAFWRKEKVERDRSLGL